MKKYNCFVISPIGEAGSQTRRDADDLLSLIVEPALSEYGFSVVRGDHRSEANQIDVDVIKSVQEADLCICNLSEPNINVYYELGRRDETGKPVILLKPKSADDLPIDIATRRYIEYDLDDRYGIRDARIQLRNFVQPLVEKGFTGSSKAASLAELADILQRIERKIDRTTLAHRADAPTSEVPQSINNPVDTLQLALIQRNIPLAEEAMEVLKYRMNPLKFYDQVVEQVAAMGSDKAGRLLVDYAQEFMDDRSLTIKQKVEYLQSLAAYASRRDKELELIDLIEQISNQLLQEIPDNDYDNLILVYNQRNKIYFGVFLLTNESKWLQKAIFELETALRLRSTDYLHYNVAVCYKKLNNMDKAISHIEKCMELQSDEPDADHLELACELYYLTENPKFGDTFAMLEKVSYTKAALLRNKLKF